MKKILESMDLPSVNAFLASPVYKYLKEVYAEISSGLVDDMVLTADTNKMFGLAGELAAAKGVLNLLNKFDEIVRPKAKEDGKPGEYDKYFSEKPAILNEPVKLP